MNAPACFDSVARPYRLLERLAFGPDLEAARFQHLERLAACRRVLILGEGDGRFLQRLLRRFPALQVDCVDASAAMLACAERRLVPGERARVNFIRADARGLSLAPASYDAAVTLFFLDCFETDEAATLIARISAALRPGALWLWADFSVPSRGWRRLRARLWLGVLYGFFRWSTGLRTRRLPEVEAAFCAEGFVVEAERGFQAGLLRSVCWRRLAGQGG